MRLSAIQRKALILVLASGNGGPNHMHAWPYEIPDRTIISLRRRGILETGRCGIRMAQAIYPSCKCDGVVRELIETVRDSVGAKEAQDG